MLALLAQAIVALGYVFTRNLGSFYAVAAKRTLGWRAACLSVVLISPEPTCRQAMR
ncbi:MAG TPA: hypothetical protein VGJ35_01665 [Burkholderiaceae bacterium]